MAELREPPSWWTGPPPSPLMLRLADLPRDDEQTPPATGGSGPAGNARLTALAGVALLIPLLAVYGTGALFGQMRGAHFAIGFVLVPLSLLKLLSTGWRVVRYYLVDRRDHGYRRAGPPWWLPRLLGPAVVAGAVVVLVSGVVLWAERTQRGPWSTVHTTSAVLFAGLIAVHVLLRLGRTVSEANAEVRPDAAPRLPARRLRHLAVAAALVTGIVGGTWLAVGTTWPPQPRRTFEPAQGLLAPR